MENRKDFETRFKSENTPKPHRIGFRVSDEVLEGLQAIATSKGVSVHEVAREMVEGVLTQSEQEANTDNENVEAVPKPEKLSTRMKRVSKELEAKEAAGEIRYTRRNHHARFDG